MLLCSVIVNAGENKKLAVASTGKTAEAPVSNMAAKCPYYLIFDNQGTLIEVLDNPYMHKSSSAGPSAANLLAKRGVTMVIAENFGSKMINTLKNKDITHFQFEGRVVDAVKKALKETR